MNINGWDVVYGCSEAILNRRFEQSKKQFMLSIDTVRSQIPIRAQFTDWKITSGGSGNFLLVQITSSGSMGSQFSFDGLQSTVRIAITYLAKENGAGNICLNFREGNCEIMDIDCEKKFDQPDQKLLMDLLKGAYIQAIQENSEQLSMILAEIEGFAPCGFRLKQFRYFWYEPNDKGLTGYLLILGVTDDRDISQLPSIVDHTLLYNANNQAYHAVFMLSAEKFNDLFMLKAMPGFFAGSKSENYSMSGAAIVNHGNIPLSPVQSGAMMYNPYISSFNFHLVDNKAVTTLYGKCPIKGLTKAFVDFSLTANNQIQFLAKDQKIQFASDPNLAITANKDIPSWEEWIGILSLGILNIIIECISASLEDAITSGLSGYSVNAKSVGIQAVKWGVELTVSEGGISDHLYIQCM